MNASKKKAIKIHEQHFNIDFGTKTIYSKGIKETEEKAYTFKSLRLLADTFVTKHSVEVKGYAKAIYFMKEGEVIIF